MKFEPEWIRQQLLASYASGQLTPEFLDLASFIIRGRMHSFCAMYREEEDVVQECMLKIVERFRRRAIDPDRDPFNYLTNCVINTFRRIRRRQLVNRIGHGGHHEATAGSSLHDR